MKSLDISQVLEYHGKIIKKTGGADGVRDIRLIESALQRAYTSFDGKDLYETTITKVAVIAHSLISNHGFVDGNKRIGVAVMLLLLQYNDIKMNFSQSELIQLGLNVASGNLNHMGIEIWINDHVL